MRLVTRLTIGFLVVVIFTITFNEYRQLDTAQADYENDLDRTHLLVATTLADTVEFVAPREGVDAALKAVELTNQRRRDDVRIRWVCAPGVVDAPPAPLGCAELSAEGTRSTTEAARRFTFAPVHLNGVFQGAIEVSESPDHEGQWARAHYDQSLVLALTTIAAMTVAAFFLGVWLVARPTRALMEKARAVGRGELLPDVVLRSDDELAAVANEMNAMCHQLLNANQRAAAAVEKLRHADRLATVGRVASGLAHELGTPLNVIEARAGLIIDDRSTEPAVQKSAKVIIECTEQVTKLVRQLLVFARPRSPELASTSLDSLARNVTELLKPIADKKGISLEVPATEAIRARADAVLLQQAVMNLVVNALNACEQGGHVRVTTNTVKTSKPGAAVASSWATLAVHDDGVGMTAEVKANLFEPFFTTRPPGEGTGLGLPIVSSIIDDHGGFLTVDSEPGRGSTLTVHLPIATESQP